MALPIYHVDAFTAKPFRGNPAAVCLLSHPMSAEWMQRVAAEMNLSETAFLLRSGEEWKLRWFTPKVEVDLCGHATLAAAHILWEQGFLLADTPARFHTKSGILSAWQTPDGIDVELPAEPESPAAYPPELLQVLGQTPAYVGKNRFDYLVELESEEDVREIAPDTRILMRVPSRGLIVTARCEREGVDFVSRFFAPRCGIPEDPVTGSAHCCLGPYWAARLGKTRMLAEQVSERGGRLAVRYEGQQVGLGGLAVTVLVGQLTSAILEDHATAVANE